jgi:SAM-dependent methyltransferase
MTTGYSARILGSNRGVIKWQREARFRKVAALVGREAVDGRKPLLLDVGAADGIGVPFWRPVTRHIVCLNYYQDHAEELRSRFPEVESTVGDVRQLKLADGTYDVVVSLETLHLLPTEEDHDASFREIRRVLRPGGLAILTIPVETGVMALAKYVARRVYGFELSGCDLAKALRYTFMPRSEKAASMRRGQVGFDADAFIAHFGRYFTGTTVRAIPARWCPTNLLVVGRVAHAVGDQTGR